MQSRKIVPVGCGGLFPPASRCQPMSGKSWKERFGLDMVATGVGSTEMGHLFLTNLPNAVEYSTCRRSRGWL